MKLNKQQYIDDIDIKSVINVLQSDILTGGDKVSEFEDKIAKYVGSKYAVALSSGTAALHSAMFALNIKPDDEVLVPAITFVATANCVLYLRAKPIFVDVCPDTLLISTDDLVKKITQKTRAIIAMDYGGHPCEYDILLSIASTYNLYLISDACHSLGAKYNNQMIGSIADMTIFSFHPVKHITTGEGGMVVTDNSEFKKQIKLFRNHGINLDYKERELNLTWSYQMESIGYNYRITDFQCALGISQLEKLNTFIQRRRNIAQEYNKCFLELDGVTPLNVSENVFHVFHLFVIKLENSKIRQKLFQELKRKGFSVNVHYLPVYLHPYYQKNIYNSKFSCPNAENAYNCILSLPINNNMRENEVYELVENISKIVGN